MSNQDRLLSDEELREAVHELFDTSFETDLVYLINTQKRLYAESVIGEDEPHRDCDRITQNAQRQRNQLRAEQRARIK